MSAAVAIASWTFARSIFGCDNRIRRDGSTSIETRKEPTLSPSRSRLPSRRPMEHSVKTQWCGGRDAMMLPRFGGHPNTTEGGGPNAENASSLCARISIRRELANTWIGLAVLLQPPNPAKPMHRATACYRSATMSRNGTDKAGRYEALCCVMNSLPRASRQGRGEVTRRRSCSKHNLDQAGQPRFSFQLKAPLKHLFCLPGSLR